MRRSDLPSFVLQDVAQSPLQHAGPPASALVEAGRVLAQILPAASRLDAYHPHASVSEEGVKETDGVRAAADAGHERVGQAPFPLDELRARLAADDALELAHH